MNWSAAEVADVPPAVVTVTSTVPAVPAGLVAVICVAVSLTIVAGVVPNSTAVAPVRFVPVIVTVVPPAVGPDVGLTPVTVGAADVGELVGRRGGRGAAGGGHRHVDRARVPAGLVAVICVAESPVIVAGRGAEHRPPWRRRGWCR